MQKNQIAFKHKYGLLFLVLLIFIGFLYGAYTIIFSSNNSLPAPKSIPTAAPIPSYPSSTPTKTYGNNCIYEGKTYNIGESFPASDGCNNCFCNEKGVICTEKACNRL